MNAKTARNMLLFVCMFFLAACAAEVVEPTAQPTPMATNTAQIITTAEAVATATAVPTITNTPLPTATPTPTATPIATSTATPSPTPTAVYNTKQIFIQWNRYGGDGGDMTDFYYGRGTSQLLIYADGQTLIKSGARGTTTFAETTLTAVVMCALRDQITATGFMEPHDEEAYYTERYPYEGDGHLVVQVEEVFYDFDAVDVPYLTNDLAAGLNIVRDFSPDHAPESVYIPETLAFWILEVEMEGQTAVAWPPHFPPLSELWAAQTENRFTVTGNDVPLIYDWFDNSLSERFVLVDDALYWIIARPILPHETPDSTATYPRPPENYIPALDCGG